MTKNIIEVAFAPLQNVVPIVNLMYYCALNMYLPCSPFIVLDKLVTAFENIFEIVDTEFKTLLFIMGFKESKIFAMLK